MVRPAEVRAVAHPIHGVQEDIMTLDARQPHPRNPWDEIAIGYDRTNTPTQMWLGTEGLRRVGLQAGMQFLDVASGSGALAIPAARIGARVIAADRSPAMLELLQARAYREQLTIETRVMDAHHLELDDDRFDRVGSQFGVMLLEDMPLGIREMVRVARSGGRVLLSVYGNPHEIEFFSFFVGAVQSVRPDFDGPPMEPPPLPFQLQDPDRLRRELVAAGLRDVQVETITESTGFSSGAALWDWLVSSNPIVGEVLGHLALSDPERDVVKSALEQRVRERAGGAATATLTNPVHIGIGTK
jgi:ubiquinone/menaquinone biosynthesis C-methylase UbiE